VIVRAWAAVPFLVKETGRMTVTMRQTTADDVLFDQVCELFNNYRVHYGHPSASEITQRWLQEQLAEQRLQVAAAAIDNRALGFITTTVLPASLTLGTALLIRDLYVDPLHRRGGIARVLLQHAIEAAGARGAARLSLQTEPGNKAALALYTAAGFQPVGGLVLLNLNLPSNTGLDP
jgi:GNAT superfamily N-acetyltransferase